MLGQGREGGSQDPLKDKGREVGGQDPHKDKEEREGAMTHIKAREGGSHDPHKDKEERKGPRPSQRQKGEGQDPCKDKGKKIWMSQSKTLGVSNGCVCNNLGCACSLILLFKLF